jgi:hypothetical protein
VTAERILIPLALVNLAILLFEIFFNALSGLLSLF